MAQMEWRKYPEVMPPADDIYLAVVEFDMSNGTKKHSVIPLVFTHNFEGEHRPGWYDTQLDFCNECNDSFELKVIYWMPYPEAPKD